MRPGIFVSFAFLLSAILILALFLPGVTDVASGAVDPSIDPHEDKPETCLICHTKIPTAADSANGDLFLIEETIDGTCLTCHPYDCCRLNSLKGHNHISDVNKWDVENFREPETVPLFDGYMTCSTCHLHFRSPDPGHKMVRLAKIKLDMIDWTELCLDCHKEY